MKNLLICILALLTFGQVAHAQVRGNEIRVVTNGGTASNCHLL